MDKSKAKGGLLQFIKFGVVGVSNTIVNQVIYMLCNFLGMHYLVSSVIAFVISVLNAFAWQTRFVFREDENAEHRVWWQVLLKTYAAYAFTGLVLNNLLLILWIDVFCISEVITPLTELVNGFGLSYTDERLAQDIAPLLNMFVTIPTNFLVNKFWAYRQRSKPETPPEAEK